MYWAESSHALSRRLGSEWLTYFLRSFDYTACRLEEDSAVLPLLSTIYVPQWPSL